VVEKSDKHTIFRITHAMDKWGALWLLHSHYQLLGRHNPFLATFEVSDVIPDNREPISRSLEARTYGNGQINTVTNKFSGCMQTSTDHKFG